MKKAIIFHGTDCKPEDFWYMWLKKQLEVNGYEVKLPYYPDMNRVPISEYRSRIARQFNLDENTVLIGHSAGVPLILSLLEHANQKIALAVMVAGFSEPLPGEKDVILQDTYDWNKIKRHSNDFIFINSDNDPWGCDDKQGKRMQEYLGGKLVILHDGHFGSTSLNQPYKEFPLLKQLILS
ncbi:MAG TPA: alpha/beta hydrolase [Patescibacteria group bacterium]|nr:alpha/beta hydrolase [Patescibacteria group bacterium]